MARSREETLRLQRMLFVKLSDAIRSRNFFLVHTVAWITLLLFSVVTTLFCVQALCFGTLRIHPTLFASILVVSFSLTIISATNAVDCSRKFKRAGDLVRSLELEIPELEDEDYIEVDISDSF